MSGSVLAVDDQPAALELVGASRAAAPVGQGGERPPPPSANDASRAVLRGTLRELERRAIVQALEDCEGIRTHAAQLLDIDRSTLRRKVREYELEPSDRAGSRSTSRAECKPSCKRTR
jgi:DNA-binding NtrC family response regulator